jgi:protein SCO1/2
VKTFRILLWALVALAIIGVGALLLMNRGGADRETALSSVTSSGAFGGPFTLVGSDGQPFSSAKLAGEPYALFFGYTQCPDVCPTTLARLVRLRRQLGKGEDSFRIVFVSVDPEHDTPTEVGRYTELFGAPVIGLTGSPAQIDRVKKTFGIYSKKVPDGDGTYTVDHTATVMLFGKDGHFVATIAPDEGDASALGKLKRITA